MSLVVKDTESPPAATAKDVSRRSTESFSTPARRGGGKVLVRLLTLVVVLGAGLGAIVALAKMGGGEERLVVTSPVTKSDLADPEVAMIEAARRIVGFYRKRWTIEQVFRTMKTKGFQIEALRQQEGPLQKLATAILIAAITTMQLVAERDGAAGRPFGDALDADDLPALERVCQSLEGKTQKQKNPHPLGTLAYAAWVFARLGGWTGYYGKPGPIVILRGLTEFRAIKQGWELRNV